ncbi:MAG TPA: hypothetical protein VG965_04200 [Patescibacteria group bacterium]|nr:hypothetical protein [Patescibacteria group bacterium]
MEIIIVGGQRDDERKIPESPRADIALFAFDRECEKTRNLVNISEDYANMLLGDFYSYLAFVELLTLEEHVPLQNPLQLKILRNRQIEIGRNLEEMGIGDYTNVKKDLWSNYMKHLDMSDSHDAKLNSQLGIIVQLSSDKSGPYLLPILPWENPETVFEYDIFMRNLNSNN